MKKLYLDLAVFFSASDIMEAVRGRFHFYGSECYLTTIPIELEFLWDFELLKIKICSLYHENLL